MKEIERRKHIRELFKVLQLTGLGDGVAVPGGGRYDQEGMRHDSCMCGVLPGHVAPPAECWRKPGVSEALGSCPNGEVGEL